MSLAGSPGCTLRSLGGERTWPWAAMRRARSASTSPFPNHFCKQHLGQQRLCVLACYVHPLTPPPPPAPVPQQARPPRRCPQLPLQERVNRKRLAPCSHRSSLFSSSRLPRPHPGRPCGEPLQKVRAGVSRCLRAAGQRFGRPGRVGSGKGNSSLEGQGTAVTTKSQGLSERGGLSPAPQEKPSPTVPIWKPAALILSL